MMIDDLLGKGYSKVYDFIRDPQLQYAGFLDLLDRAQVFDFKDISAAYDYHRESKGTFIFSRDVFCVRPPFPLMWVEAKLPAADGNRFGALIETLPPRTLTIPDELLVSKTRTELENGTFHVSDSTKYSTHENVLTITATAIMEIHDSVYYLPRFVTVYSDAHGNPITIPIASASQVTPGPDQAINELIFKMKTGLGKRTNMAWFGMSLLSCKNITPQEIKADAKLQAARQRRGKKPLKNHYVLRVTQPGAKIESNFQGTAGKLDAKRLHLVRGHLADYREGKGLFGKLKGIFWIPAHARGAIDKGVIEKTYQPAIPAQ